jgi:hypothetical protein
VKDAIPGLGLMLLQDVVDPLASLAGLTRSLASADHQYPSGPHRLLRSVDAISKGSGTRNMRYKPLLVGVTEKGFP